MPTSRFGKVRRLLKDKKAKVIRRNPFTIKLLYSSFVNKS
nr:RRXRR domain-containing protein [uncultured Ruminococcus sp.]